MFRGVSEAVFSFEEVELQMPKRPFISSILILLKMKLFRQLLFVTHNQTFISKTWQNDKCDSWPHCLFYNVNNFTDKYLRWPSQLRNFNFFFLWCLYITNNIDVGIKVNTWTVNSTFICLKSIHWIGSLDRLLTKAIVHFLLAVDGGSISTMKNGTRQKENNNNRERDRQK